jgi:hypothetical protein
VKARAKSNHPSRLAGFDPLRAGFYFRRQQRRFEKNPVATTNVRVNSTRFAGVTRWARRGWLASVFAISSLGPVAAQPLSDEQIATLEREFSSQPRFAAIAALRRDFPEDYRRALSSALARMPNNAQTSGAAAGAAFRVEFLKGLNDVLARDADEMAHADLPLLDRCEATFIDLLKTLQASNPRGCLDYAVDFAIGDNPTTPADELAIAASVAARLDALADGKARKTVRAEPSELAFDAFARATADMGMSSEAFEQLKKGKSVPAGEVAAQCQNFLTAHRALASLPTEARTNLLANGFVPVYYGRQ